MRNATVTTEGDQIRRVELPGREPARVCVHGPDATSPAYFAGAAVHPLLAGHRSLLIDLLGHGISDRPTTFDHTLGAHADALATVGVAVAPIPDCGHNIMLDDPDAFTRATSAALTLTGGQPVLDGSRTT